jgi:hypothetical protein
MRDTVLEFDKVCPTCGNPRPRKCSECGTVMIGFRKQAVTCSGACRVARHRRLAAEATS